MVIPQTTSPRVKKIRTSSVQCGGGRCASQKDGLFLTSSPKSEEENEVESGGGGAYQKKIDVALLGIFSKERRRELRSKSA
jgi:hypothetical protein